ncbi:tyrosyl-tRNA synthetase [Afifella sp. IM 167]|uniref:tyrosyl-tRNA synthetase n=1 Tax=Afifella sp. IM 167 TaxID=2033586 RepID=UPI001CCC31B9|nr:tyrosyl-tRNA synthetase [Afifella sp. IM 167]MBZ8133114.1 tyrosyl-tRNA synthetase [Afifella sp. IM 167]
MFKKIAVTALAVATIATATVSTSTSAQAGGGGIAAGIIAGAAILGVGAAIANSHPRPYYGHRVRGYCEVRKVRVWSPRRGHYVWRNREFCY